MWRARRMVKRVRRGAFSRPLKKGRHRAPEGALLVPVSGKNLAAALRNTAVSVRAAAKAAGVSDPALLYILRPRQGHRRMHWRPLEKLVDLLRRRFRTQWQVTVDFEPMLNWLTGKTDELQLAEWQRGEMSMSSQERELTRQFVAAAPLAYLRIVQDGAAFYKRASQDLAPELWDEE